MDASGYGVSERIDLPESNELTIILNAIIQSKSSMIRFSGKSHKDYTISAQDRRSISETFELYNLIQSSK